MPIALRHVPTLVLIPLLLIGLPALAEGQGGRRLTGQVTDPQRKPVEAAEVRIVEADTVLQRTRTDSLGRYAFPVVPARAGLTVQVRRLGYKPNVTPLYVGETAHDVDLRPAVAELDEVLVLGDETTISLDEFEAHRKRSRFGTFFDPEMLRELKPRFVSELLRHVPGVRLLPAKIGNLVRIRGCQPLLWVNGSRVAGVEVDEFVSADDVAAVEVYNSFAGIPPQYVDRATNCGAIVIWVK